MRYLAVHIEVTALQGWGCEHGSHAGLGPRPAMNRRHSRFVQPFSDARIGVAPEGTVHHFPKDRRKISPPMQTLVVPLPTTSNPKGGFPANAPFSRTTARA